MLTCWCILGVGGRRGNREEKNTSFDVTPSKISLRNGSGQNQVGNSYHWGVKTTFHLLCCEFTVAHRRVKKPSSTESPREMGVKFPVLFLVCSSFCRYLTNCRTLWSKSSLFCELCWTSAATAKSFLCQRTEFIRRMLISAVTVVT